MTLAHDLRNLRLAQREAACRPKLRGLAAAEEPIEHSGHRKHHTSIWRSQVLSWISSVNDRVNVLPFRHVIASGLYQLLKWPGELRQYTWNVTAQLVSGGYDFTQNVQRLQASIEQFGVVIGVDAYTEVAAAA